MPRVEIRSASFEQVFTETTPLFSTVRDLRWSRSVHSCEACPYSESPGPSRGAEGGSALYKCGAVHYGICTPVTSKQRLVNVRITRGASRQHPQSKPKDLPAPKVSVITSKLTSHLPAQPADKPEIWKPLSQLDRVREDIFPDLSRFFDDKFRSKLHSKSSPQDKFVNYVQYEKIPKLAVETKAHGLERRLGNSEYANQGYSPSAKTHLNIIPTRGYHFTENTVTETKSEPAREIPIQILDKEEVIQKPKPVVESPLVKSQVETPVKVETAKPFPPVQKEPDVNQNIPAFYFGNGLQSKSPAKSEPAVRQKISSLFSAIKEPTLELQYAEKLTETCACPKFWKVPLFVYCGGTSDNGITQEQCLTSLLKLEDMDDSRKLVEILTKGQRRYLVEEDFVPLIQDVVETHPGLTFLLEAQEFHTRYIQTVIARIFFNVNRSWTGRITANEIRRSNLLQILRLLEEEDDINNVTCYFSYEHFYVIYCTFWELDTDHDLYISQEELATHNNNALSSKAIERVFSSTVSRNIRNGLMPYKDFVWFLIAEEDKLHPTSIEYWFRIMDIDGDGIVSIYEMIHFYEEQMAKMEQLGIEPLPVDDLICQILDMISPKEPYQIRLRDIKQSKLAPIFFDTFLNLEKYLEHEQRDPFANFRDDDDCTKELSDWDRYAAGQYELLVAEEGSGQCVS